MVVRSHQPAVGPLLVVPEVLALWVGVADVPAGLPGADPPDQLHSESQPEVLALLTDWSHPHDIVPLHRAIGPGELAELGPVHQLVVPVVLGGEEPTLAVLQVESPVVAAGVLRTLIPTDFPPFNLTTQINAL